MHKLPLPKLNGNDLYISIDIFIWPFLPASAINEQICVHALKQIYPLHIDLQKMFMNDKLCHMQTLFQLNFFTSDLQKPYNFSLVTINDYRIKSQ